MEATEHTLRYLRDTFDKSVRFARDCPIVDTPWGWVDSDWAGDTDTRRSHPVYIVIMNGGIQVVLSLGSPVVRIPSLSLRLRLSTWEDNLDCIPMSTILYAAKVQIISSY